jgi:type IV secretion system protein VirB1
MIAAALLACAMSVHPATLEAVIRVESGGSPTALHVNRLPEPQPHASSVTEAAEIARRFIAAGYSVDLGLMQVNSANLPALGYSIEDALDPCRNIAGGGAILTADYARAVTRFGEGQAALQAALRAYNTGSFERGDVYLAQYFHNGDAKPAIPNIPLPAAIPPPNPYTATTVVFSREEIHVRID